MDLMRSTQAMTEDELHRLSDKYDSVYLHPVRPCHEKEMAEEIQERFTFQTCVNVSGDLHSGCDGGRFGSPAGRSGHDL